MSGLKIAKADAVAGYTPVQMRCPMCHEQDANMSVDLATGDLGCNECGDTLSFEAAQEAVEELEAAAIKWRKLLGAMSGLSSLVNDAEAQR
jgi:recombinational DNA repair protein (RecF pathway)